MKPLFKAKCHADLQFEFVGKLELAPIETGIGARCLVKKCDSLNAIYGHILFYRILGSMEQ